MPGEGLGRDRRHQATAWARSEDGRDQRRVPVASDLAHQLPELEFVRPATGLLGAFGLVLRGGRALGRLCSGLLHAW